MASRPFTFHPWPLEVIIYGVRPPLPPPNPPALPKEIRLDLWPSFTSARIKAALCSYCPGPHESNFIDHSESDGHPLNIKWRGKATRCVGGGKCRPAAEIGSGITSTPSCDETAATASHKYGNFPSKGILHKQRGLKNTFVFSLTCFFYCFSIKSSYFLFIILFKLWLNFLYFD